MTAVSPSSPAALPFLKWAGGKQRLLSQYQPFLPARAEVRAYFEPFIGSAALFFYWQPEQAILSDRNEKLIELYCLMRDDVAGVIEALRPHRNEADYYYHVRAQDPAQLSAVQRAARLIYLNKTCYNGLYRENARGDFNVPFGRYKNPTICDESRLRAASQALQAVELVAADFEEVVAKAQPGDFIYFDPPYAPLNATSSFTSYNSYGFTPEDQKRLAATVKRLTALGCQVMLSNSSTPLIYALYQGNGYHIQPIQARRNINSKADRRGPIRELLITNYPPRVQ
jgi:DNA adenine methylase